MLRAVHDHARQHRRQRRPALDPARPATPRSRASSGRSTATRSPSPSCSRPAGGSATSSAAAACSSSASSSSPLSSATAGLAQNPTDLVVSRVVQGVGAALMMPATLSIVTDAFPPHERGKAMGTWAGVSGLALAIGPVVGGLLTEHVSWRAIFYLNIPVAIGAVTAALFAVRESRDTTVGREVDFAGVAVLTACADGARPRPRRGQRLGLGLDRDRRPAGRRRGRPRRLRRDRAAGQGADGRIPLLLRSQLPRRRGRRPDHLLRDAGRLLLPRPLHAGHPRLLAARGRDQVPALDADDRRPGADLRPPGRPLRPALADRRRDADDRRLALHASPESRSTPATSNCCPGSCCSASGSR